jgi:mannose-1-phosphate guanylyltransferase
MRNDSTRNASVGKIRTALVVRADLAASSPLEDLLAAEGFSAVVECRGAETVPAVERIGSFDLAVVESDVEGAGALDLIAYLRHRMPGTPVLFVAPADASLLAEAARERGATACLTRPVHTTAATAVLRAAIGGASVANDAAARPLVRVEPAAGRGDADLWAVVLAGGEGRRLRPLVRHVHGDLRPKQYARLAGPRSLLEQTLDRTERLVPSERTVLVTVQRHRRFLREALAGRDVHVLRQPSDRGTAAGVVLPAQWVAHRAPAATVAIFPSDHFIAHERRFTAHVADAVAFVNAHPTRILLVGATASGPETEYGWIEPGEPLGRIGPTLVSSVTRFVEKPSLPAARACLQAGALWNTFVIVARAAALADATRQVLPRVHDTLAGAVPLLETAWGVAALRRAYATLPAAAFSSAVLERCAPVLAVSHLAGAGWCDWGSPRRVVRTLRQTGQRPDWLETFAASRLA